MHGGFWGAIGTRHSMYVVVPGGRAVRVHLRTLAKSSADLEVLLAQLWLHLPPHSKRVRNGLAKHGGKFA
jgi:hypothetical protein